MNCFNSSDAAARDATIVYNFYDDEGDFWNRSLQDGQPLPSCASSSPPLESNRCIVCVDQVVYAVCRNLTDGVKLTMEADSKHVRISKSGCPDLHTDEAPQWKLPVAIVAITLIFIITISIFVVRRCRRRPDQREQSRNDNQEANHRLSPR